MSLLIILYNQLRLNARAAAFGLFGGILSVGLYSAFYVFTPLDPCLMGLPAGFLIVKAISLGSFGKHPHILTVVARTLYVVTYLFGTLPVDLWRHSDQPFMATLNSVYNRLDFIFGQGEEAESLSHFAQIVGGWLSLFFGIGITGKKHK
jgi:hypothetical protein